MAATIFFYKNHKGIIVQVTDKEAYTCQYEYAPPWEQIGASDGARWREVTREIRKKMQDVKAEVRNFESQKVAVPSKLRLKFATTHAEFQRLNNLGIAEELEIARGNIVRPPKNHIIGTPAGREAMGASRRIQAE
jgi:hypothetical protein